MILEIKQIRMAESILKAVHECDAGMKQGVLYYRNAVANADPQAIGLLRRAARLPFRVESRIQALVTKYSAPEINAALALVSKQTLGTLRVELNTLKAYSETLRDNFQNQGWTVEQIAVDIETNRATIDADENAPIPTGYVDNF